MNTVIQVIFFLLSALILGSGIMVVVARNIIHAALFLIGSFAGVGALYFLLEAPFIGVIQILVYGGAISVLMLFAIMLTRHSAAEGTRQLFERWWLAAVVAIGLFFLVITPTVLRPGLPPLEPVTEGASPNTGWPRVDLAAQAAAVGGPEAVGEGTGLAGALEIGFSFMGEYLLPFEAAAILLLAALIGAVAIAYEERSRRRRVLTLAEEAALRRSLTAPSNPPPLTASSEETADQAGRTARTY
jgi:NADH:ubiquinone oxidoreductase subunit 6 (subunit J)